MIANERQFEITKEWIARFEKDLAALERPSSKLDPESQQLLRDSAKSMLEDLRDQAADYEVLRDGAQVLELHSLLAVPGLLVHARNRMGLTEAELAGRVEWTEEQVRCFEASAYAGASLEQVQAVLDALGIRISERLLVPWRSAADGRSGGDADERGAAARAGG